MTEQLFNPFEDRLSRDIRNQLSEGLAEAVETGDSSKLAQTVDNFRQQPLADYYRDYLENRYACYQKALAVIGGGITDPIQQALVLWNLGLFFEVHEVLEHVWYTAEGKMRVTLQALIRAAGVFIKKEYGFTDSAKKIAAKAIPVLEANRDILDDYFKTETLTDALKNPHSIPPTLG